MRIGMRYRVPMFEKLDRPRAPISQAAHPPFIIGKLTNQIGFQVPEVLLARGPHPSSFIPPRPREFKAIQAYSREFKVKK